METKNESAKDVVLSYIRGLDSHDFAVAKGYLNDDIKIRGPDGEAFSDPAEFIEMLQKHRGKYDVKKVFVDGDDVCLLYDYVAPHASAFMCSWYQVREGKITSIQTIFDPRAFSSAADKHSSSE